MALYFSLSGLWHLRGGSSVSIDHRIFGEWGLKAFLKEG